MSNAEAAPALPIAQRDERSRRAGEGYLAAGWRRLARNRGAMVCLILLATICAIAAAGPWINEHIVGYDPNKGRLLDRFQSPNSEHWLGTDEFGRDTLARLIAAGRVSLTIGFTVAAIQLSIGI